MPDTGKQMHQSTPRDVYIAIMRAAARGVGLRLTPREVFDLSMDDAIATAAVNGLADGEGEDWARVNPRKRDAPGNAIAKEPG